MRALFRNFRRLQAWFDLSAFVLLVVGCVLFGARVPLPADWLVNLPALATIIQIMGGMLIVAAMTIIVSRIFWVDIKADELIDRVVKNDSPAAATVLLGLLLFCGLVLLAFAVFVALLYMGGAGVGAAQ